MPGEQLTCVWQAVTVFDVNTHSADGAPKDAVRNVTAIFQSLQSVNYSENVFHKTFTGQTIKFDDYKKYTQHTLREKGVSFGILRDNLEDVCWNIVKPTFKTSMSEDDLQKLWKITNRLVKQETYPPRVCKEEACWFTDKILGNLGKNMISTDEVFKEDSFSFIEFINILEDLIFKETIKGKWKACIDDLYCWLVAEILKKEKVYIRCKKQSNWTSWGKRCCILTPRSVSIYTGQPDQVDLSRSTKKIELVLTKNTKVESLSMYKGIFHHLNGRFRISNQPIMELEIAVDDECEKRSWLTCLEELIACIKDNTTPVQKLLHDRYTRRMQNSSNIIPKTNSLEKLEIALDETHRRVCRAISIMPNNERRVPSIHVQGSSESSDLVTVVEITQPVTSKPPIKHTAKDNKERKNKRMSDIVELNREKLKAVFVKIDQNGNGLLDKTEFSKFIEGIGLNMTAKEVNLVFKTIDTDIKGQITFDQFAIYFSKYVMDETTSAECVNGLRKAFLEADRDGSGTLNFREFTEYVWEKKRSIRMSKIINSFSKGTKDEINFTDFQQMMEAGNSDMLTTIVEDEMDDMNLDDSAVGQFQNQLKQVYSDADSDELTAYIRDRWKKFATFRRQGKSGTVVMKGGHGMVADFVPGEYSLIDLTCFSDLPPLVPKYTAVKGVTWVSSTVPGKSGKIVFPPDFDRKVITDVATTELVRYYGCSFADANQEKVSLLYRHGIQDFTYENGYLEKYVSSANGGSGIERHEFSHLDCPLTPDSGVFILAKFTDDGDFHITGFRLPVRHTLYIPGGCIHSNDYLSGTWRTMLSDETDIDHVHLTKRNDMHGDEIYDNNETKFQFQFV